MEMLRVLLRRMLVWLYGNVKGSPKTNACLVVL